MPRHLLSIRDLSAGQIVELFDTAADLRRRWREGVREHVLAGKVLALLFEKPSLRTRVSFEAAMAHLGGSCIFMGADHGGLGVREPVKDFARTLSRYVDGIVARVFDHQKIQELARYSQAPVVNALSDFSHPCQGLADFLTIRDKLGRVNDLKIAFVGDGNNVARSLAFLCEKLGCEFWLASPKEAAFDDSFLATLGDADWITQVRDPNKAAFGADILYTDVWISMGQEAEAQERRKRFAEYRLDAKLLAAAKPGCLVMHCLPAHRGEEIAEDVIEGPNSVVFDQAENRLHVQKAVLYRLLHDPGLAAGAIQETVKTGAAQPVAGRPIPDAQEPPADPEDKNAKTVTLPASQRPLRKSKDTRRLNGRKKDEQS